MIGVFDSGLGGLSALLPLLKLAPHADVLYYADTAALPLGEKSDAEIRARLHRALGFFAAEGVSGVLLACGTASSLLTDKCKESFTFPIIDILSPTASAIRALPKDASVLFLGTPASVRAARFPSALARGASPVFSLPCPSLVRAAESGKPCRKAIAHALAPAKALSPQAVVLGCTHFSLLAREIAAHFPSARMLDAASLGAAATAARVPTDGEGTLRFVTTDAPDRFSLCASRVLSRPVRAELILS